MGRRTRRRAAAVATSNAGTSTRAHQARVNVSDETWREFRRVIGNDSIAAYLGRLVEQAVERNIARRIREGDVREQELLDALERARELHSDLGATVERLECRLDQARRAFTPNCPRDC